MGDSVDPKLAVSIKKTQDLLGKYVKKPPLSDKNLARPPFRFLHDVVTTVINSTGFMNGILSPDELDSAKITTKEAKNAFMQKIINAISDATGEQLTVKVSKILAGQEPEKTNELLQALAKAIEKSGGRVKPSGGKPTASKTKDAPVAPKDKKPVPKTNPGKTEGPGVKKPGPGGANRKVTGTTSKSKPDDAKKPARDPSPAAKNVADEKKASGSRSTGKAISSTASSDTKSSVINASDMEAAAIENIQNENTEDQSKTSVPIDSRGSALKRKNSTVRNVKAEIVEPLDETMENPSISLGVDTHHQSNVVEDIEREAMNDDFKNAYMKPNMEMLAVPTSPIISDSSAMQLGFVPESSLVIDNDIDDVSMGKPDAVGKPASSTLPGPSSGVIKDDKKESKDDFGRIDQTDEVAGPSTAPSRNRTGNSRISSSRPPSARPAPPRPKSSMFKDSEESNYRPTTGKVSNVLLDSPDTQDDDDNFIVRETAVVQGLGLADLDETPELALTSDIDIKGGLIDDILPPEQRGLLVNQILETQKELEDKENEKNNASDVPVDRTKTREVTVAEIEKLKNLIQGCARSANPLGKLLDYVREDMDAMQKELSKWRDESRQLDMELESTKQATEASLQPLQQQLKDVEIRIQDKEDAIASTKMSILKHQERIEKILSGLDRVQSSHGKISLPSASQLMQPKIDTSSFLADSILIPERPMSSSFGGAINRLAKTTTGMRPIFDQSDDLDPDSFNPWKD